VRAFQALARERSGRCAGEEGRFGGRTGGGGCGCGRRTRSWRNLAAAASRLVCGSAREMAAKARARAGDRWWARASARAEGEAREREELRRRRMDGVRDPSTLRCPPQREAWWFLAASGVSKTQRPNKTRFPSLSSLNCLPRHHNADVAP